jgi:hypothetical protein
MTWRQYFLPEGPTEPGGGSAIPERLEMKPDNSSDTGGVYIDEADVEYVYDLEPSRYPYKIQLDQDLPKRMIQQLRHIIDDKPISPELRGYWDNRSRSMAHSPVKSKSDTHILLIEFWYRVIPFFDHIRPEGRCQLVMGTLSRDKRVRTDVCIKIGSRNAILADAVDPALAAVYAADLVSLASGDRPSPFEKELPQVLPAHEGIISKVTSIFLSSC